MARVVDDFSADEASAIYRSLVRRFPLSEHGKRLAQYFLSGNQASLFHKRFISESARTLRMEDTDLGTDARALRVHASNFAREIELHNDLPLPLVYVASLHSTIGYHDPSRASEKDFAATMSLSSTGNGIAWADFHDVEGVAYPYSGGFR